MNDIIGTNIWVQCLDIDSSYAPGELACRFNIKGGATGVSVPANYVDLAASALRVYVHDVDFVGRYVLVDFNRECDNGSMRNWVAFRDLIVDFNMRESPGSVLDDYLEE